MADNALAFIAGLGTGYLGAKDKERQNARQDKKDAQDEVIFNAKKAELERAEEARKADIEAAKPVEVVPVEDRTLGTSTFNVGAQNFASREDAAKAADSENSPEAVSKRRIAALRSTGRANEADQLQTTLRQGKLADIGVKQAEDAQERDKAFREITTAFSQGGWSAVPKIYDNYNDGKSATVAPDGKGGAVVTVVDKDGKTVAQKAYASEMDFITNTVAQLDPKLWVGMKDKQADKAQAQANADRAFAHQEKMGDAAIAHQKVMEGLQQTQISISKMTASIAKAREEREKAVLDNAAKIPEPERLKLASLGKHIDMVSKAVTDAKAKGEWQPDSPGAKDLMAELEKANTDYALTLKPFMGSSSKSKAGADPLGLNSDAPNAASAGTGAPPAAKAPAVPTAQGASSPVLAAQGIQPAAYDPSNPLSVVQHNNQAYDAARAKWIADAPAREKAAREQAAKEAAQREAWLKGNQ